MIAESTPACRGFLHGTPRVTSSVSFYSQYRTERFFIQPLDKWTWYLSDCHSTERRSLLSSFSLCAAFYWISPGHFSLLVLAWCQSQPPGCFITPFSTIIGKSTPERLCSYSFSIFLGHAEPSRTCGNISAPGPLHQKSVKWHWLAWRMGGSLAYLSTFKIPLVSMCLLCL